jgi:ribosomal protein S18 acetylase RimI-like enzyme
MEIRCAQTRDLVAIATLDRKAWKGNKNADFIPDGEHAWRIWIEHALVFCAVDSEAVIGAVLAFPCRNGLYCLHKVFVDPDHRGRGAAHGLLEAILAEIDTMAADVFLTVDPSNVDAVALYERWGFGDRRFVAGYYRAHEDRLVLTRRRRPRDRARSGRRPPRH